MASRHVIVLTSESTDMPSPRSITLTSGNLVAEIRVPDGTISTGEAAVTPRKLSAAESLENPLGFPRLLQCVVPGDRVVIAVDPETPQLVDILSIVWEELQLIGSEGVLVTVLLPQDPHDEDWSSLQERIPVHLRKQASVRIHDPSDESQRSYLATTAKGERLYLAQELVHADLIVTIGVISFDGLLGYRGTTSAVYPSFSDAETIRIARGLGHRELSPDSKRPLRDLIDEIEWLLGTQFAVQVVPDAGGVGGQILAGRPDEVFRTGKDLLRAQHSLVADAETQLVVVSVPGGFPQITWQQVGAALETACRIVEQGGRIAIVADVGEPDGPAAQMLRRCAEPEDLLKPLRLEAPEDAVEITQLIHAQQRARIYLLSQLPETVVEELGMHGLSSAVELQRLIDAVDSVAVIPNANFAFAQIAATAGE